MKELVKLFKALANENRIRILQLIIQEGPISLSEIAKTLNIPIKTVSKYLIVLENVDLVSTKLEDGKKYFYLPHLFQEDPQMEILKILKRYKTKK